MHSNIFTRIVTVSCNFVEMFMQLVIVIYISKDTLEMALRMFSPLFQGVVAISAVLQVEKLNTPALRPLYLHPTFGKDPDDWSSACPMSRLQNKEYSDLPNFLVITAEKDWHLHHEAAMFAEELGGRDAHRGSVVFPRTTHLSIICNFDRECEVLNTSVANQCVQFIQQTYDAEQTSPTCALQRNRGNVT